MSNPFAELFTSTEQQYGLPEGYLERTARVESSFNPSAKNPNSSAGGLFQFIDGTAKQYGLADRYDPVQATDAAARLARDNAAILKRTLGRDPTAGELYLAHQQGAGGAVKLLSNPDAPAEAIVGSAAARLNGGAGLTAGQLAQKWTAKIDGGQPPQGGNQALAYAATRGRDPRASMPAPDATQAMGQMQMPSRQPMPDLSNTPDAGLRAMIAQQAGGMEMTGPSIGGLGGLGGMRIPQGGGGGGGQPAPSAQPQGHPDIESLIPAAARDPFAIIGPGAAQNQQWEAERQGKVAMAQELVRLGIDPRRAVGLVNTDEGRKLALGQIQQAKAAAANKEAIGALAGAIQPEAAAPVAPQEQPAQSAGATPAPAAPPAPVAPPSGAPAPSAAPAGIQAPPAIPPQGIANPPPPIMKDDGLRGLDMTQRAKMVRLLPGMLNPNTPKETRDLLEIQYKNILDESKLTAIQKEYAQARAQGFQGGLLDYKKELANASRSIVSVDNRAEGAEAKGRGEGVAKRWNDIADDGIKANEDAVLFQRFGDILSTVKTGKGTETLEKIRQATGLSLDPNTDNVQALNAMINYIAPRLRVPGSGAQSDRELGNFLQSIPSLAGSPEGNKKILDTMSGIIEYRKQRAAIAAEWQNGDISAKEAQQRVEKLPPPFKSVADEPGTVPKAFTKADFDKLPSGARFISPDGKERIKP